ncbi:MAG: FIST signal transduction protein [Phormidesmis sp.]
MSTQIGSTQIGVGVSHHRNPVLAGKEAVEQALNQADIQQPDFVMLFSTVGYRQAPLLKSVRAATHHAPLIGCSGAGILAQGVTDESNFAVVVLAIQSDEMQFSQGMSVGLKADSGKVGEAVGKGLTQANIPAAEAKTLFLFLDGITPNFDEFMAGLRSQTQLEENIPAIGGFAGDNVAYKETFQYYNDELITDGAVWAVLSGTVEVDSVSSHGCVPMGMQHTVTKSDRNIVYEVDNQPVLDVLGSYLTKSEIADWGVAAVNMGWGFDTLQQQQVNSDSDEKIIRCMIAKNEETQSVQMFSDVPEGSRFWITRRDHEQIYSKAEAMSDSLLKKLDGRTPKLIFHVECDGRGKLIFRENERKTLLSNLQTKIGPAVPWVGLYAFAEIGPIGQQNCLQNFAGILTAFH